MHHGVGVVVVGVDEDELVGLREREAGDLGFVGDFAGLVALGEDHHDRHLVHAGAVIPRVGIPVPGIAGGGVAEADAQVFRVESLAAAVIVDDLLQRSGIEDAGVLRRFRRRDLRVGKSKAPAEHGQAQEHGQKPFYHAPRHSSMPSALRRKPLS